MARPAVFDGKDRRSRPIQGIVTAAGSRAFERARLKLGALYARIMGRTIEKISDGDTVEYLARGHQATQAYLEIRSRKGGR